MHGDDGMITWIDSYEKGMKHTLEFEIGQAKKSFDKSLHLSIARRDNRGIAANLVELGRLYIDANYFQTAEDYLNRALKTAERIPDRHLMAICLQAMSDLDLRRGNLDDALEKCRQGRRLIERDSSPESLKGFDTRIEMLSSDEDIHLVVASPELYRSEMGLEGEEPAVPSDPNPETSGRYLMEPTFPLSIALEGFPPPARFQDMLSAVRETWERASKELSDRYGRNWCITPNFDEAVNADARRDYVVSQLKAAEDNGYVMIGAGKANLMILVWYDIAQKDEGGEQQKIVECFQRHWADVIDIPYEPSELVKLTVRKREDGSIEVVKPGIQDLRLRLPISAPSHARTVVPAITAALTDAHQDISRFAGAAWCANWVHVLPPVFDDEVVGCLREGRFPACTIYPDEQYVDLHLEVLQRVADLDAVRVCIEENWHAHRIGFKSQQLSLFGPALGRSILLLLILAVIALLAAVILNWLGII